MHQQNFEKLQSQKIALRYQGILGQEKSLEISAFLVLWFVFCCVDRGNQNSFHLITSTFQLKMKILRSKINHTFSLFTITYNFAKNLLGRI